jgi:hypothetical protein
MEAAAVLMGGAGLMHDRMHRNNRQLEKTMYKLLLHNKVTNKKQAPAETNLHL